jgi:hypothetical protein
MSAGIAARNSATFGSKRGRGFTDVWRALVLICAEM